ncbi:MAG: hypothetical protein WCC48_11335, partial [Anaeromyxobacteraceae bacterium]
EPAPPRRAAEPVRRRRWPVVIGVGAVLIAAVGAGAFLALRHLAPVSFVQQWFAAAPVAPPVAAPVEPPPAAPPAVSPPALVRATEAAPAAAPAVVEPPPPASVPAARMTAADRTRAEREKSAADKARAAADRAAAGKATAERAAAEKLAAEKARVAATPPTPHAPPPVPVKRKGPEAAEVRAVLARTGASFDECVRAAAAGPDASYVGRSVDLYVEVAPAGNANDAFIDDDGLASSQLGKCLKRAAMKMTFSPFEGEPVPLRMPLRLSPK